MTHPSSRERPPAMVDVAKMANVSQKTVSRVVNGEPNVSEDARSRVVAAIEELGFVPNRAARTLVTSRSRTIGVISSGSSLHGPASMSVEIEKAAQKSGYTTLITHAPTGEAKSLESAIADMASQGVDGIVISYPGQTLETIRPPAAQIPLLALEHRPTEGDNWILVGADNRGGARAATEHLLGLGHETVWHITGPSSWGASESRRAGWQDALADSGCAIPPAVEADWSVHSGYEAGRRLVAENATAVFAANDDMAIGAIRAFTDAGKRVPEDISVIGFDDLPVSEYLVPALTTVRQDFEEIVRQGMRRLTAAMEGHPVASRITSVTVHLVFRETTAPPP